VLNTRFHAVADEGSQWWKAEYEDVKDLLTPVFDSRWGEGAASSLFDAVFPLPWFQGVMGRLCVNCFGIPSPEGDDAAAGAGLFIAASYINHDCGECGWWELVFEEVSTYHNCIIWLAVCRPECERGLLAHARPSCHDAAIGQEEYRRE